jgi:hypothetical protein
MKLFVGFAAGAILACLALWQWPFPTRNTPKHKSPDPVGRYELRSVKLKGEQSDPQLVIFDSATGDIVHLETDNIGYWDPLSGPLNK